jgi:hypothetical protein
MLLNCKHKEKSYYIYKISSISVLVEDTTFFTPTSLVYQQNPKVIKIHERKFISLSVNERCL